MRFQETGQVVDGFYVIGTSGLPVYLLDGPAPAIFDAGNASLSKVYLHDIKEILGGRSPAYLFITHSHFDHIGAASRFKAEWPDMTIAASEKTREILSKPKAVELIKKLSNETYEALLQWGVPPSYLDDRPFKPFAVDQVVSGGREITLYQEQTVQVLHTPGHTWDFLSYWLPRDQILIASEAVGCVDGPGPIVTEFLVDYDAYRKSLESLSRLNAQVLCTGHHLVLTGSQVREYLEQSMSDAVDYVRRVEKFLKEEDMDVERAAARVKAAEWDPKPWPKQPEAAYMINTTTRVNTLKKRMSAQAQTGLAAGDRDA